MISLRRLVLPSTESSMYNFASNMRNVSFLQSFPKRVFTNRIIQIAEHVDQGKNVFYCFEGSETLTYKNHLPQVQMSYSRIRCRR